MKRTQLLQEKRKVRFEEILRIWTEERLSQEEAARMLGFVPGRSVATSTATMTLGSRD